jgi:uncharacterized protein (TIGR03000 family)
MIRRGFVTGIAAIGLAFTMAPPADAQMYFGGRRGGIGFGYPGSYYSGYSGYYGPGYYGSGFGVNYGNRFYSPTYGSSAFYPSYGYAASNVYYPNVGTSSYVPSEYTSGAFTTAPMYGATSGGYTSGASYSSAPSYSSGAITSTSMGQCDVGQPSGSSTGAAPGIVSGTAPGASAHTSGYTPAGNTVNLMIRVPDANAEVLIDGQATQTRGTERQFVSPPLESGKYSYKVTARWKEGDQQQEKSREVQVQPGDFKNVDFTSTGSEHDADRSGDIRRDENRRDQDRTNDARRDENRKPLPDRPAPRPEERPAPKPEKE